MKVLLAAAVVLSLYAMSYAETVNPASNVSADTDNTPGTIVLRHSSTGIANITVAAGNIDTAKIAAGAVDTSKLNFVNVSTVDSGKIVCIKSGSNPGRQLGTCKATSIGVSICQCE